MSTERPRVQREPSRLAAAGAGLSLDAGQSAAAGDARRAHEASAGLVEQQGFVEAEHISEPRRIDAIVQALLVTESQGYVVNAGNPLGATKVRARAVRDGRLLLECCPRSGGFPSPPFEIHLEGYNSSYRFLSTEDGTIGTPALIVRVRRRRERRAPAPRRLRVTFGHPALPQTVVDAPVVDVSLGGLAIELETGDGLSAGTRLRNIELSWKGGTRISCDAIVAHCRRRLGSERQLVGLRLLMPDATRAEWRDQLEGVLHPRTARGTRDHELFWQTYVDSGYFNLSRKAAGDFDFEKPAFVRSHELLRRAPEVGAFFVRASEKRVEAVAHQISPWPGSWLFYQFCRRPNARPASVADDNVLMDLYAHAYEYVQERSGAEWLVTYVQDAARFSRLIFHDLGQHYAALGRATVTRFRAIEIECAEALGVASELEVGPATPLERRALSAAVRRQRPEMYVKATGLADPELGVDSTIDSWGSAGLARKRQVLVARRAGRLVAGAVLDAADDGLHLFGLLDVVRMYALDSGGESAFEALLDSARAWYASLGKHRFAYFANDDEHPTALEAKGRSDLGAAYTIVLPVDLLPELLEHVHVTTSRGAPPPRKKRLTSRNPRRASILPLRPSSSPPPQRATNG